MNSVLILSALLFSSLSSAAPSSERIKSTLEAQPSCSNFVRFDNQNVYLGFGGYRRAFEEPRSSIPAKIRVAPLDGTAAFELATKDASLDIVTEGSSAFVLTYSSIEEWDLATRERMDEKYYFTCFSKASEFPGDNGGNYRRVPLALDRRVLMLD